MPTRTRWTPLAVLAATACLALAGCGDDDSGGDEPGGSLATSSGSAVKTVTAGKLTTCTHLPYAPFQSEQGGKVVGFDVDLVDLVAKDLGLEQKIVDTPFETIQTGADLNAGKCDIAAAGMTITEAREKNLDFTDPYFDATQALLAKKGSGITSLDSAKGKKMGSQSSTTGESYVRDKGFDSVSFETSDAELNGLRSGQVDVIVQDLPVVSEWLKDEANSSAFEIVANLDTGEQYGFAVRTGNDALRERANAVLKKAREDGTYAKVYEKWIGPVPKSEGSAPEPSAS